MNALQVFLHLNIVIIFITFITIIIIFHHHEFIHHWLGEGRQGTVLERFPECKDNDPRLKVGPVDHDDELWWWSWGYRQTLQGPCTIWTIQTKSENLPIIVVIIVLGRFLECKDNDQRLKVEPVDHDFFFVNFIIFLTVWISFRNSDPQFNDMKETMGRL